MVFIPGISKRNRKLERRKGGGGGGRGGGGGGRGGGGGGSSGSGGGRPGSISSGGAGRSTSSKSFGGGPVTTIPQGLPFAGRQQGGGNRNQIFGSRTYGSGYPGASTSRGVAGLPLPYYYWPVVFGAGAVGGGAIIYHEAREYGDPNNSTRPGGPMMIATFSSNSVTNSTFRLLADNSTVDSLVPDVVSACGSQIADASSIKPSTYNESGPPGPGQAIQYYRASSIVLSLDSYNNTAAFTNDTNAPNSPLPSNIDSNLLNCLNNTIGQNAPLVDSGAFGLKFSSPSNLLLVGLIWTISRLVSHV